MSLKEGKLYKVIDPWSRDCYGDQSLEVVIKDAGPHGKFKAFFIKVNTLVLVVRVEKQSAWCLSGEKLVRIGKPYLVEAKK